MIAMNKIRTGIDKILENTLVVLMIVLVLDVTWQILSRYVNKLLVNQFDVQIPNSFYAFTDELAGFLLIWVALAGAAYATGKKEHLAIDLLSAKFGKAGKARLTMLIDFLIFVFALSVLIVGGTWLVYTRFYLNQVSAAMEIPIGIIYLMVPVSGLLISYYVIDDFINANKAIKE
jgi:TRAP-type C4-dicarboxylate transport system permease small subunit